MLPRCFPTSSAGLAPIHPCRMKCKESRCAVLLQRVPPRDRRSVWWLSRASTHTFRHSPNLWLHSFVEIKMFACWGLAMMPNRHTHTHDTTHGSNVASALEHRVHGPKTIARRWLHTHIRPLWCPLRLVIKGPVVSLRVAIISVDLTRSKVPLKASVGGAAFACLADVSVSVWLI